MKGHPTIWIFALLLVCSCFIFVPQGYSQEGIWSFTVTCTGSVGECTNEVGGQSTLTGRIEISPEGSASFTILSVEDPELDGMVWTGVFEGNQLTVSTNEMPLNCGLGCDDYRCDNATASMTLTFPSSSTATGTIHVASCCLDHGWHDFALEGTLSGTCTDNDSDGYGNPANPLCDHPEEDCNDSNPDINPGADEICTGGIDEDCDTLIDDADPDCQGAYSSVANAQASAYGPSSLKGSGVFNQIALLLVPVCAVLFLRIITRRRRRR